MYYEVVIANSETGCDDRGWHRDGDRLLQLSIFNEELLVSASHQLALITSRIIILYMCISYYSYCNMYLVYVILCYLLY